MNDIEVKNAVADLTNEIRETYRFSLFPTSELYKEPEEIVDIIGGGILYDADVSEVSVCRCGSGFLIRMPKIRKSTMKLIYFAQGLAVLFLKLKYEISEDDFYEFENMKQYPFKGDVYQEFSNEMLCPLSIIDSIIERQTRYGDEFCVLDIAKNTGLNLEYIQKRMNDYMEIRGRKNNEK